VKTSDYTSIGGLVASAMVAAGVSWALGHGGIHVLGLPVVAWAIAAAFAIQWIAFVPAFLLRTERFYDLTGSVTYITVVGLSMALSRPLDARSLLLSLLIAVWAVRLGTFLFRRVRAAGKDARFDVIKRSFPRFLTAWTVQGLWVSLTLAAALAAITATARKPLGMVGWIGLGVWSVGLGIEAVADEQKSRFRKDPANRGRFISRGLWRWSRHPNYFGEIVLWIGVALIAVPVLSGWRWVGLISPAFVVLLLTRVSGIPLLERRADDRWGGEEEYETYKRTTPVLIPRPPRRNPRDSHQP